MFALIHVVLSERGGRQRCESVGLMKNWKEREKVGTTWCITMYFQTHNWTVEKKKVKNIPLTRQYSRIKFVLTIIQHYCKLTTIERNRRQLARLEPFSVYPHGIIHL